MIIKMDCVYCKRNRLNYQDIVDWQEILLINSHILESIVRLNKTIPLNLDQQCNNLSEELFAKTLAQLNYCKENLRNQMLQLTRTNNCNCSLEQQIRAQS